MVGYQIFTLLGSEIIKGYIGGLISICEKRSCFRGLRDKNKQGDSSKGIALSTYIRAGISIPNKAIELFKVRATTALNFNRKAIAASFSDFRILISW